MAGVNLIDKVETKKAVFRILKRSDNEHPINVQIWFRVEDGLSYAGYGKFCKSLEEAHQYINEHPYKTKQTATA